MQTTLAFLLLIVTPLVLCAHEGFVLEFQGRLENRGQNEYTVHAKAHGSVFTTVIHPTDGVSVRHEDLMGTTAQWHSHLKFSDQSFQEFGNVTFGVHQYREHRLHFQTDGPGHIYKAPEAYPMNYGAATFKITGGEGVYLGAQGSIACTFDQPIQEEDIRIFCIGQFWFGD